MSHFNLLVAKNYTGSLKIIRSLCYNFVKTYPSIKAEALTNEPNDFMKSVHSLKGISLNFGAEALYEIACELEESKLVRPITSNDVDRFLIECDKTVDVIKKFLGI